MSLEYLSINIVLSFRDGAKADPKND